MRTAYVHDWLVTYRGGEKVLEALVKLYPEAPLYTLFYDAAKMPTSLSTRQIIYPKFVNSLRFARKAMLPFLPALMESMPLEEYDLVISSSSCVAKGVLIKPNALHLCYLHSPMRYIWDQRKFYLQSLRQIPFARGCFEYMSHKLRIWDQASSTRVDRFIVNSNFVKQRVEKYYGKPALVIPPPCGIECFLPLEVASSKRDYYLAAGAFVPYKRFDIAIEACERAGVRLIVAGSGPDEKRLRRLAGKHTEFVIAPKKEQWQSLIAGAKALLFPGVEDFGIIAIEAMAAGTPVIAFRAGGALDFIEPGKTGVFFDDDTPESLITAIQSFDHQEFDMAKLKAFAGKFSESNFLSQFRQELTRLLGERRAK